MNTTTLQKITKQIKEQRRVIKDTGKGRPLYHLLHQKQCVQMNLEYDQKNGNSNYRLNKAEKVNFTHFVNN